MLTPNRPDNSRGENNMKSTMMTAFAGAIAAATTALALSTPAQAYPQVDNTEDQSFLRGLDRSGVLSNFNLQKSQGQQYCADVIEGATTLDATYKLMRDGGYSFDVANSISSAAGVSYCLCADFAAMGVESQFPGGMCSTFETNYRNPNLVPWGPQPNEPCPVLGRVANGSRGLMDCKQMVSGGVPVGQFWGPTPPDFVGQLVYGN
jgi:hypothetical protein